MSQAHDLRVLTRLDEHREQVTLPLPISDPERAAWVDWFARQGISPDQIVQTEPFIVDDAARTITVTVFLTTADSQRYLPQHGDGLAKGPCVHVLDAPPLPWPELPDGVRYVSQEPPR